FGKVGGLYGHTDVDAAPSTLLERGHKEGWGVTGGVGAAFRVAHNLDMRADWDRYLLDFVGGKQDIDMQSVVVLFALYITGGRPRRRSGGDTDAGTGRRRGR